MGRSATGPLVADGRFTVHRRLRDPDDGGWLPTGASMTVNKTGQPEAVLTAGQWDTLRQSVTQPVREVRLSRDDLEQLARLLSSVMDTRPVQVAMDGRVVAEAVRRHDRALR